VTKNTLKKTSIGLTDEEEEDGDTVCKEVCLKNEGSVAGTTTKKNCR